MAGWLEFTTLTGTQTLAIWGAVTGTIGTITGILGLWLRYRHQKRDQARLNCEVNFEYEVSNGVPKPKYKITVRCIGRRPVNLDGIEYFYNPKDLKDRIMRRRLWRNRKWRSKDDINRQKTASLLEGQKAEFLIEAHRFESLAKVARVSVVDQTGRNWPVKWPGSKELAKLTQHGELDHIEEENTRRKCTVFGYEMQGQFYIVVHWTKDPPNKSASVGRSFRFDSRDEYARKLEEIRSDLLPKLLAEKIDGIS